MAKVGRPPGLTPEKQQRIVDALSAGNYLETAAANAGVWAFTVRRWIKRGNTELERRERGLAPNPAENEYAAFAASVREAESNAEGRAVVQLVGAGAKDWHASLAFLERRHPRKWAPRVNVILEEEFDAFFAKLERKLPAELYDRVLRALDEPEGEGPAGEEAPGEPHRERRPGRNRP